MTEPLAEDHRARHARYRESLLLVLSGLEIAHELAVSMRYHDDAERLLRIVREVDAIRRAVDTS